MPSKKRTGINRFGSRKHRGAQSATFRKYTKYAGKWYPAGQGDERYSDTFTISEFARDNADDPDCDDVVIRLKALRVGGSFTYDGGAGGVDRFKRIS